jgi:pimeloyl-ACP methyl ester carboxylesterase
MHDIGAFCLDKASETADPQGHHPWPATHPSADVYMQRALAHHQHRAPRRRRLEESLAAIRQLTKGPQILIGSSMGGWLTLLAARALHKSGDTGRLKGLVLLAPAVDFSTAI